MDQTKARFARALTLALGAGIVACFALSVCLWALLAMVIPGFRRALLDPERLTWGNCHVYTWLRHLNDGVDIVITPSIHFSQIPHSHGGEREFVPLRPRRGRLAVLYSFWFRGHVRDRVSLARRRKATTRAAEPINRKYR